MNEKNSRGFAAAVIVMAALLAGGIAGYFIGSKNTGNSGGTGGDFSRERALLERIGEYERREADRIARENERIGAERARIDRTENAIRAIRGLDRQSGGLLQELAAEVNILADFFWSYYNEFHNRADNSRGEQVGF